MNINIIIVLLLSLLLLVDSDEYWDSKRRFCGSILATELHILCKGVYNVEKSRLLKRGIIEDCCKNACSKRFLKENYCPAEKPEEISTEAPIVTHSNKVDYLTNYFEQTWNILSYVLRVN